MADAIEAIDDINLEAFRDDSVPDPCAPTATPRSPKRVRTSTMRVLQLEAHPSAPRGVADAV